MGLKWLQEGPKMQNFPGRCPWTPLGGSERPQTPSSFSHNDAFKANVRKRWKKNTPKIEICE